MGVQPHSLLQWLCLPLFSTGRLRLRELRGPAARAPDRVSSGFRSFQDCIPRSFRRQIRQHSALTRLRLRSIFRRFLRAFQPGRLCQQVVMVKYLATLERLAPRFGSERVPVCHLALLAQAEGDPYYIGDSGHAPSDPGPEAAAGPPTHEVLVTGTGGIQWRPVQAEVSGHLFPSWGTGRGDWGGGSCSTLAVAVSVCPLGLFLVECPLPACPLGT